MQRIIGTSNDSSNCIIGLVWDNEDNCCHFALIMCIIFRTELGLVEEVSIVDTTCTASTNATTAITSTTRDTLVTFLFAVDDDVEVGVALYLNACFLSIMLAMSMII